MSTFLRRSSVAVAAALLAGACTVHKSETPTLTGPSEFGLSVNVSAIPDSINQDGASQSAIVASVHDASGQPKAGVSLRADIGSGYGQLSANTMVTGADGKASTVYTAPAAAPGAGPTSVSIVVTPIGTDYQAAVPHAVSIRLSPPGVVVPVIGAPLPRFVVTPAAPNANSPATLDGTSSCGSTDAGGACTLSSLVVKWAWDFGDGTTGSGPVVTHAFPLQQTYSVTLTVTNDKGVSMFRSQSVVVGPGLLPTASFTFSPAAPGVGDTVYFNAAASTPGAGHTIASYQWSSGDGNVGTGMTPTYKFLKQGSFTVTLVVVDEAGQKSPPATQVIAVGAGTPKPTAEFTSSVTAPVIGDTVIFDASASSTVQGQTITDYAWNFGDDTPIVTTHGRITTHVFSRSATFVVNLVVTDSAGRTSDSKSHNVIVGTGNPLPAFSVLPVSPSIGTLVTFDASSTQVFGTNVTIQAYSWDFGDNTTDTNGPVTTHTYGGLARSVTVTLTVVDSVGRRGQASVSVVLK